MPELLAALDPSSHDQDDVLNAVRVHGLAWTLTILVGSKSQADQLILSPLFPVRDHPIQLFVTLSAFALVKF